MFFIVTTEFSVSRPMPPKRSWDVPAYELRTAGHVGVEALEAPVVERQDVVLPRLDQEQALELGQLVRLLVREVVGLRPVVGAVQLPDVVVERRHLRRAPTGVLCRVTAVQPWW